MMTESKTNKKQGIFRKFCQETNAPGFGHLVSGLKWGRLFWAVTIVGGIAITSHTILQNWNDWSIDPIYIMTEDFSLEITNVAFPGVAICNMNKISKKRVTELARSLSNLTGTPFEDVLHLTKLFGNLYDPNSYGVSNISEMHYMLKKYDNGVDRNKLVLRMASLITPCKELIQNCRWDSQDYNCATLFKTRLTDSGFCCLFNSIRSSPEAQFFEEELSKTNNRFSTTYSKFPGYGISKGLSVTINNNFNDYFYSSLATKGAVIKIFSPDDYADFTSGSLRQIVVAEGLEAFVDITANTITAEKAVRWLTPQLRKCVFKDESENSIGSSTASNCFVDCRLKSMVALCKCIPFILPVQSKEYETVRVCNLLDTICLSKYQGKWLRYYPNTLSYYQNRESVGIDLEDSLFCRQCLPNCEEVTYEIYTYYHDYRSEDPKFYNSSKVHIYSNKPYTRHYQKLVKITWYEALSTLGGIASLISGITIINLVEVVVVIAKKLKVICENIYR